MAEYENRTRQQARYKEATDLIVVLAVIGVLLYAAYRTLT